MFPFTFKEFAVVVPLTVKSLLNVTSLLGTIILPVPFARNSKSAFVVVVVI